MKLKTAGSGIFALLTLALVPLAFAQGKPERGRIRSGYIDKLYGAK